MPRRGERGGSKTRARIAEVAARLFLERGYDAVTVADVIENLKKNTENAQKIIREAVKRLPVERACKCGHALRHAIMTDIRHIPESTRHKLELLLKKYVRHRQPPRRLCRKSLPVTMFARTRRRRL